MNLESLRKLRIIRKARDIKQGDFAHRLGVSLRTITTIECDEPIGVRTANKILESPYYWLLAEDAPVRESELYNLIYRIGEYGVGNSKPQPRAAICLLEVLKLARLLVVEPEAAEDMRIIFEDDSRRQVF